MRDIPPTTDASRAPATAAIRADAVILDNRRDGGANHRLRLQVPGWPPALPGQFVMLSPGALGSARRDDPLLPRPMAVFRQRPSPGDSAAGPEVEILYKREGRGTRLLADARAGERIRVVGPLGRAFALPAAGEHALIVGGGTGIASLFGLAAEAPAGARRSVVLGARSREDLMAVADFEALDVALRITTEDGSLGEQGLVTGPLGELLAAGGVSTVYCCGPTPMMRRCAELAAEASVRCVVSLENHMACGFGVCLGCAAPRPAGDYALVCRDGPVFDARDVRWEGMP